jgi:hypothetical protein
MSVVVKSLVCAGSVKDPVTSAAEQRVRDIIAWAKDMQGDPSEMFGVDLAALRESYKDLQANDMLSVEQVKKLGLPIDPCELDLGPLGPLSPYLAPIDLTPVGEPIDLTSPRYVQHLTTALGWANVELVATFRSVDETKLFGLVHSEVVKKYLIERQTEGSFERLGPQKAVDPLAGAKRLSPWFDFGEHELRFGTRGDSLAVVTRNKRDGAERTYSLTPGRELAVFPAQEALYFATTRPDGYAQLARVNADGTVTELPHLGLHAFEQCSTSEARDLRMTVVDGKLNVAGWLSNRTYSHLTEKMLQGDRFIDGGTTGTRALWLRNKNGWEVFDMKIPLPQREV